MVTRLRSIQEFNAYRDAILQGRDPLQKAISICLGAGCRGFGAGAVADAFEKAILEKGLTGRVVLRRTGCHGFCERAPMVVVDPQGIVYGKVKPGDAEEIVERTVLKGELVTRLLCPDGGGPPYATEDEIPFYKNQTRHLLAGQSRLDPTRIDDYLASGGYTALAIVLSTMKPEAVIASVKRSGLRGRGGGGFPAGVKWETCRKAPTDDGVRYIICNADEGDPGAFMDCALMEGNPHSVIEGMVIGAWAIGMPGKPKGYVYIRNEYPVARERLAIALEQARELGFLGRNILGSGMDFDISVNRGGGAFVCGESTALMASIEGSVGEPRAKHIHTVVSGLWGKPTNLNNVETWANIPLIVHRGAEGFASVGTGDVSADPWGGSTGTKIFSLVGKVENTGLVEVPMGTSLRRIIFDIGGGIKDGKRFKAVQTGGPSGGCLPESLLDMPVDYDRLTAAGSMMGSGGMIVMDESTCMVDVARYFLHFLADESCGKCTTCREGLRQLSALTDRICAGKGEERDLELLESLSVTVSEASLCALGQSAPNPLRSTLRYFRDEYEEHVRSGKCRAKVCKALIRYTVSAAGCDGCGACAKTCPAGAIAGTKGRAHAIDPDRCTRCGACVEVCRRKAIAVE